MARQGKIAVPTRCGGHGVGAAADAPVLESKLAPLGVVGWRARPIVREQSEQRPEQ